MTCVEIDMCKAALTVKVLGNFLLGGFMIEKKQMHEPIKLGNWNAGIVL